MTEAGVDLSKPTLHYSRDDTCILAGLPSLGKSEEHKEFASLFHSNRRGHVPPPLHVGLELELLRSSLGKLVSQRRNSRIHEVNPSPVSSNFDDDLETTRPLSPGVYNLLKDLENCLEKTQRLDEPITPCDFEFHNAPSVSIKSSREHIPSIYSSSPMANTFKHDLFTDRAHSILEYKSDSFTNPTISADKSNSNPNTATTVNEAFINANLAGWLSKLYITNPSFLARKTWKRRFFILSSNVLYRFKSLQANTTADEYLEINSNTIACVSDKFPGKKWVIEITNPGTSWYIQAECLDELKTWLNALKSAVIKSKYNGYMASPGSEFNEYVIHESTDDHALLNYTKEKFQRTRVLPPQPPVPQGKPPSPPSYLSSSYNSSVSENESRSSLETSQSEWGNSNIDRFLEKIRPNGPGLLARRLQNHPNQEKHGH